jgi:hypothetical protein
MVVLQAEASSLACTIHFFAATTSYTGGGEDGVGIGAEKTDSSYF